MGKPLPKAVGYRYFERRNSHKQVTGIARIPENESATVRIYLSLPQWKEVSRDGYLQAKGAIEGFNAR